jgi:NodT family efflux transporter outer membrane factor (OMF) lipoprotein
MAVVLFATSCAVTPPPETPEIVEEALPETTEISAEWTAPADDAGEVDDGWIEDFGDQELVALVNEAVSEQNPNLRVLSAQVDRAAGLARQAGSALKPTVALGGDISETSGSTIASGTNYGVGVGVSWEVDVWGKVRAGATAAEENLRATAADFEFARQSLAANVAKGWFLATELKQQTALAQETVDILSQMVDLVKVKEKVGQVSMQDVHLVQADLASAEDALRQVESGRQQAARSLEILMGRYPAAEVDGADELVAVPPPIPVGIPADILERRPDLVAAERRVAAAFFLSEQARLAKLPSFTLTAGVGGNSTLDTFVGNLAAGLFAPLYTGGALEGQIDVANADQKAAVAAYGTTVLKAFEEVETSLTNEDLFAQREGFLVSAVDNNFKAYELALAQYDVGKIDLLSVLQMQSRWLGARVGLIRIKNERLAQRVNLHLALGGSFRSDGRESSNPTE